MKNLLLIFSLILTIYSSYASEDSLSIWSTYFPKMDCEVHPCARNIPSKALEAFLERSTYLRPTKLEKTTWAFIVDMDQPSKNERGYLVNLKTGKSKSYHVSHGVGSADGKGNAVRFSNINESKMTSLGLYLAAETYFGKHGLSLKMDGLEETNKIARQRAIVIHGAKYMSKEFIKKYGRAGRSWGCPAIAEEHKEEIMTKLKDGSLYYIYKTL